jgi:hypothetical protein
MSRPMRVLVACEFSGTVRDAFLAAGHDAISCDILPTEVPGPHHKGDVFDIIGDGFDLMVAHPPCTYLANSGFFHVYRTATKDPDKLVGHARWKALIEGAVFFRRLLEADIPRIAIENPVMVSWAKLIIGRGQDQTIQPWQFGHGEVKATGLWLKNLPPLLPTEIVPGREARVHRMPPGPERSKARSVFYPGIAEAMAHQWGATAEAVA